MRPNDNHGDTVKLKATFFDVGNTLVFQNRDVTLKPLHERGLFPTRSQINVAERVARTTLDQQILAKDNVTVDRGYWDVYYQALLDELGIADSGLKSELARLAGQSSNWSVLADQAEETLAALHKNYRLGVISNSDEHVAELLAKLGIGKYFDCIIASSVVGHEKPDRRIFEASVDCLGIEPEQAVYVGDIYSVDYLGASAIGMRPILVDPYGVYSHTETRRIESLKDLVSLLNDNSQNL
jgi:putative hydrolase of the HAD superfamily